MIYRLLNAKAKAWWYHKTLRDNGEHERARKLERRSILDKIKMFRKAREYKAAYVFIGRGGCTFYFAERDRITGFFEDDEIVEIARHLGITVIDTTTVPIDRIAEVIKFPMIKEPADPEPWGSLSYAPLKHVAKMYAELGATVHNLPA